MNLVKPSMSITLGNSYNADDSECAEITIQAEPEVLDDSFAIAAPEVFVSNKKALLKKDEEIRRITAELNHTKEQLRDANARIEELIPVDA